MTTEAEDQMISQAKEGNAEALDQLVKHYIRYAYKIALVKYRETAERNGAVDCDDLHQLAALGIMYALKSYDVNQHAFLTWVKYFVLNACRKALYIGGDGKLDHLEHYLKLSLDKPVKPDDPDGSTLGDFIPDPNSTDPAEVYEEKAAKEDTSFSPGVDAAIDRLPEKKQYIIRQHYQKKIPYKVLAAENGTTLQSISAAQKEAFKILRRDARIKYAACHDYCLHVGVNRYQRTGLSSVEVLADEHMLQDGYYDSVMARKFWEYYSR